MQSDSNPINSGNFSSVDFKASRQNMVESQVRVNDVTSQAITDAMRRVKRERLCAASQAFAAYAERAIEISPDHYLMQARDIGKLIQAVLPVAGETALAIGAPYAAAVMAEMGVKVTYQEPDSRCVSMVSPYLRELRIALADEAYDAVVGKFDIIITEGAVAEVPESWLKALKSGGRLGVVLRNAAVGQAYLWQRHDTVARVALFDSAANYLFGMAPLPQFSF